MAHRLRFHPLHRLVAVRRCCPTDVGADHGHRTTRGKAESDDEMENPAFTGSPDLDIQRIHEDGPVVGTAGEARGGSVDHGRFRSGLNDLFAFRDGIIARVDSYVVPLP